MQAGCDLGHGVEGRLGVEVEGLATAAQADPRARDPWPERDLALAATFCVTGIREGEAVALGMGSLEGTPGARRLQVVGKGNKARAIPIEGALEKVLEAYLATRQARFPRHDLDHPATPLFVDVRGRGLSVHQVKYLIERLYIRAGLRARVPAGALVHALRHTFAGATSTPPQRGSARWCGVTLARWRSGSNSGEAETKQP
ncbi:MAG TPA: tyrosine-type recombinase/integrase [Acidimicrobiales bacterium]|nr:tyrosine-type recombinase/integrase [Acidimicrobiales bacterium]